MRKLLVTAGIVAIAVPLLIRAQGGAQGGGAPGKGVLGPVNALGQEVRRPTSGRSSRKTP